MMPDDGSVHHAWSAAAVRRLVWTVFSLLAVESVVFGLAFLPASAFWLAALGWVEAPRWAQLIVAGTALLPAYVLFAIPFLALSAFAMRLTGWRSPPDAEMRISDLDWPLLDWARYQMSIHVARILVGTFVRATPLWSLYLRWNGARIGRRVWVNSLWLTDHNLLEFDDDVVIGSEVHLSGHTVERGVVKTALVRLGAGVVVGVGANVEIGVEAGPGCQIGALSVVPKHAKLEGHCTYVGAPAHKLPPHEPAA